MGLDKQARFWGTPTTRDWKDGGSVANVPENGLLGRQTVNWASPTAGNSNRDTKLTPSAKAGTHGMSTAGQAGEFIRQHATTTTDGQESTPVLNPRFAEMLMGWPIGYTHPLLPLETTAFEQWETASSRSLWQQPGLN